MMKGKVQSSITVRGCYVLLNAVNSQRLICCEESCENPIAQRGLRLT